MRHLDRDARGYAIPYTVLVTSDGKAHFAINDDLRRLECLQRDYCPICGGLLPRLKWFVGGPLAALHPDGAYIDLPMHPECKDYALRVCPYLAAPSYAKRIEAASLRPEHREAEPHLAVLVDETADPDRPDCFVAILVTGFELTPVGHLIPNRPYKQIEVWRHGEPLARPETDLVLRTYAERILAGVEGRSPAFRFIKPGERRR